MSENMTDSKLKQLIYSVNRRIRTMARSEFKSHSFELLQSSGKSGLQGKRYAQDLFGTQIFKFNKNLRKDERNELIKRLEWFKKSKTTSEVRKQRKEIIAEFYKDDYNELQERYERGEMSKYKFRKLEKRFFKERENEYKDMWDVYNKLSNITRQDSDKIVEFVRQNFRNINLSDIQDMINDNKISELSDERKEELRSKRARGFEGF